MTGAPLMMARVKAVAESLKIVVVVLRATVYARRNVRVKLQLAKLRRSLEVIDANLGEIRKRRVVDVERDDAIVAERARRELDGIDLVRLADYLRLKPASPKA